MSYLFEVGEIADVALEKLGEFVLEVGQKLQLFGRIDEAKYLLQQAEIKIGYFQKQLHVHK